jgi:hypothetical protein
VALEVCRSVLSSYQFTSSAAAPASSIIGANVSQAWRVWPLSDR